MGVITPLKPPPDNLGSRQRALNARVNETIEKNIPFDIVREEPEYSDVDKLYKIDVAARYKDSPYISEILKSGDSLYTSRALKKCQWLYTDEYSDIINPEYLQQNIFPSTSMKIKRKITKTAATKVTNPQRAIEFFHYCLKEKMMNTAFTCLLYTTEEFKLDQLRNNKEQILQKLEDKEILYFRLFVGKSFILLEALLNFISIPWKITKTARQFKNLFNESEEKYLDLAEKYVSTYYGFQTDKFDMKLSEAIMKKHKHRVLTKPKFYVNTVDTDVLVQNSTIDDAKIYAKALLPDKVHEFWALHHYYIFGSVFQIIPHEKTYDFFKKYFAEHYPNAEFDMHPSFYKQEYYKFMTNEQREEWAYRHLKSEKQILGVGRDYLWYRFIKFDEAFEEIKRYISVTKDAAKRSDMVQVLIESAKNDREFEALFKYYNKRHINETRNHKESFLSEILSNQNVFQFDEDCWTAFYPILLAIDQSRDKNGENSMKYKTIALIYHIIHNKDLPEALNNFLLKQFDIDYVEEHLDKICDKKQQVLHEYLFSFYLNIIAESKNKTFEFHNFGKEVEPKWNKYFQNMVKSMALFNEDGEEHVNYSTPRAKKVRHICPHEISGRSLLRDLKKDTNHVIAKLERAQEKFESCSIKINTFLRKLKIYFPDDDVTRIYLDMFQSIILNEKESYDDDSDFYHKRYRPTEHILNAVGTGVNAIFQLANEDVKIDFMKKYYPVGTKIERKNLGKQHLRIQKAICRYACMSRQPVPLTAMLMYMKAEYVKYCLHIFNTYLALLPRPMCQQFVTLIIDAPVSIQKHAIRIAFRCFNPGDLKEAISKIWNSTKNVSLRSVIYKAFFNKVVDTEDKLFYDVLEIITLDINQDDEDAIFNMMTSKKQILPEVFLGNYIEACWTTIRKFKNVEPNITRKTDVICFMREQIRLANQEFISTVVDEHIDTMIRKDTKLKLTYSKEDVAALYKEKWLLIPHYVVHNHCPDHPPDKYVQLALYIVRKMIESWDKMAFGVYVYQKCCWEFFNNLKEISLVEEYVDFEDTIPIFEGIMKIVDTDLPFYDSYLLMWELNLLLITANVIERKRAHCEKGKHLEVVTDSTKEFGEKVGQLVSDHVKSDRYFISFSSKISEKINEYVPELLKLIYTEINEEEDKKDWKWKEHLYTVMITLASALIEFELAETYLLAIKLVPTDCAECSSDLFKRLICKFQDFPNAEVQLSLYQKLQKYCNRKHLATQGSSCDIN